MQEFTLEEYREGMVHCGTLINRLCGAMRELEAQLAEVRSEVQEGRCRCNQAQFSALRVPHDGSGESTTQRQPTSSTYKDDAISSSSGDKACHPCLWSLLPQKKLLALIAQSLLREHHGRNSLCVPNKTPLLLQDVRMQKKMYPDSNP
ncbi:hypothetical protein DSO57_1019854 [Entomophthora muscae]|uniref:Uncharacterized protein n=1 Tax=Entomophthora muscae TaxID=34485 RepID=A0ACC2SH07_9FUNG|nr:hypothetical protein DSO57_1019854 [Entomophthora muscae]